MAKKGLTLLEIVISTSILAVTVVGLASIFVTGKRYILHSRSRMAGGELGKLFLEPLQLGVRQDTWADATNPLAETPSTSPKYCDDDPSHTQHPNCPPAASRTIDNITYTATYNISRTTPVGTNLNRVKVDVNWNEPAP